MRKGVQLVLCLLLSAGIWLIHNLSESYVDMVSVPVLAQSNIDGHTDVASTEATITAQVKASGFRHLKLQRWRNRVKRVAFASDELHAEGGNIYSVPSATLLKYANAIFGEGVDIESIISQTPRYSFAELHYKKVPIHKRHNLNYEPQYMATSQMKLEPDSVLVYGEPSRLEHIESVPTRLIVLSGIKNSVHGKVEIEAPQGLRLSVNHCYYAMEVSRYVEIEQELKIGTKNVPYGADLAIFPSVAKVRYRCKFPFEKASLSSSFFYVDYQDFAHSINGRCVARVSNLPTGVIRYEMNPEVFDCIERIIE